MKTLTLEPSEVQLLLACIAKQPYEAVAGLVMKISMQLKMQEQADEPAKEAA